MDTLLANSERQQTSSEDAHWSYEEAFCRNQGILTPEEQETLRNSRVAIIGMGGVGGVHLMTLARLGIGKFTIADPDTFELANFNRQYGANVNTLGRPKAEVMAEEALSVNPELDIKVLNEPVSEKNINKFFEGADILVDGVDLYAIEARRVVFREAAVRNLYAITAGPVGFSTAWLNFAPNGMSFDRYFDITDEMDYVQKILAFLLGASPKATQLAYLDLRHMDVTGGKAPSLTNGCHLASGVVATEVTKVLLRRGHLRSVPHYQQFDPYVGRLIQGRLYGGNRHPWQRIKRWWMYRLYKT